MTSSPTSSADSPATPSSTADRDGRRLGVLLACFVGRDTAGKARKPLESKLRSNGADVLDTTVIDVDDKHKAHTHDPRRVRVGTFLTILVWGGCGVLTGGWLGAIVWGVLGGIAGYFYIYYKVHLATKAQLAYLGSRLPANSSTLLTFAATRDSDSLLTAAAAHTPSVASVASIRDDLTAEVMHLASKPAASAEAPSDAMSPSRAAPKTLVNMILTRYPDPDSAGKVGGALQAQMKQEMKEVKEQHAAAKKAGDEANKAFEAAVAEAEAGGAEPEVELVIKTDRDGSRHVTDPNLGTWAVARAEVAGWAIFCAACGVIVGLIGNGFWGGVEDAVIAGVVGGIFGFCAGALYGHFFGRAVSERRLKPVAPLLAPGTSTIVAWAGGALRSEGLAALATPGSQQLVLHFNAAPDGAVFDIS